MEQGRSTSLRLSSKSNKLVPRDISESLGKLPPQARDLEEAVLGALMLEKNALNAVVEFLKPEHFYADAHREIYQAIIDLFKASEPVDMRTRRFKDLIIRACNFVSCLFQSDRQVVHDASPNSNEMYALFFLLHGGKFAIK